MTTQARHSAIRLGTLALGVAVFAGALYYIDVRTTLETARRLGIALPFALLLGGLWHLVRTWAWAACFPRPRQVGFMRLARVRIAAEAFSYLTLRGIAGEPLKIMLLSGSIDARQATAAIALERIAYLVGTIMIIGAGAACALIGLPLTPLWFGVFRAFAIGSAALTVFTIAVVLGRGTYFRSLLRRIDHALGTSLGESKVAGFIAAVEGQMLDLVRGSPRRLLVLMSATAVSYLLMLVEGWVILRAAGAPITPNRAFAVETLSRVASFASAFIPANLGALEVSSLAAVTAVGAAAGGTSLALARRLRGLFWAGVGLAIYPRQVQAPLDGADVEPTACGPGATLLYFPNDPAVSVPPLAKLAGLPIAERVIRAAVRAGYSRAVVWAPEAAQHSPLARLLRRLAHETRSTVKVATVQHEWDAAIALLGPADSLTVIGPGTVVSASLLARARELPAETGYTIDVAAGPEWPESGVIRMTAEDAIDRELVEDEVAERRPRALPQPSGVEVANGHAMLAIRIAGPAHLADAEETIRRASYKDTDAKIARFNRRISLPISIALIPTALTANQLSIILVAIGFYSSWLFSLGHYWTGVLAAFLSLSASVLDGCDGEIARLKYQESALGCWIETFGDYSYYLAIFAGLTVGAVRQTHWDVFYWLGGVTLAGMLLSFGLLIFLRSRITAGRPQKLHAIAKARFKAEPTFWSRIVWRMSFVATRAAIPYGIMAFSLLYALPGIVVLAAIGANVYWMSLVMKMPHLLGRSEAVAAA
jgi:phosphatidylglycerophosphate synthase